MRRGLRIRWLIALGLGWSVSVAAAQSTISFEDVTAASGIDTAVGGVGVSTFDFNDDGYDDLTIARADAPPALLRNNGDATFTDVTASSGITSSGTLIVSLWVDVNRDALPDLFLGQASMGANALWLNQGDGTFIDVAEAWGLDTRARVGGASFSDFTNDGYPDLFLGVENGFDLLYRNVDGTGFEDVTELFGVEGEPFSIPMQPTWIDIDEDGDRDLFVTHDEDEPNFLYINQDGRAFMESAAAWGIREVGMGNSMGVTWGDPDLDGDLDAYVTRIGVAGFYVFDERISRYLDQATQWRVAPNGVGWGTYFVDLDNDGDEDLPVVHSSPAPGIEPPALFENVRTWFNPVYEAGAFKTERSDMGLAVGDFNADGRQDLIVTNTRGVHRLLLNTTPDAGNWITVQLLEEDSNPAALGARIELDVAGETLVRVLQAGDGYNGQNTYRIHFGLGTAPEADALRVRWPDGRWESFGALAANGRYRVKDGKVSTRAQEFPLQSKQLDLWPNPSRGIVTIRSEGGLLTIQDVLGRLVVHGMPIQGMSRLDLSHLSAGAYLVTVASGTTIEQSLMLRR